MPSSTWLLYGASGYTGELIAEEAAARGHRPVLAGRAERKLRPLAGRLGLEYRVADLRDAAALDRALADAALVLHAAGPFIHTAAPMVQACLRRGAHYLDITGEVPVFEYTLGLDAEARAAGIVIMSGVGFDVAPSDCLAKYVAEQLPGATALEIAVMGLGGLSAGTAKSGLEHMARGAMVRRAGKLVTLRLGAGARRVRFPAPGGRASREHLALIAAWGDLSTAYRTTGIPDITTYLTFSRRLVETLRWAGPLAQEVMRLAPVRRLAQAWVERVVRGPDERAREAGCGRVWARASAGRGQAREAWLVTPEPYAFTALSAVTCVEQVLGRRPAAGALTPAQAFGADFVLTIPGVQRYDRLE